jgi:hypothetical protein
MQSFKHLSPAARALTVVCTLLVLIVVFWAGTAVGRKQAEFGYRWDKHYFEVFDTKMSPFAGRMMAGRNMMFVDSSTLPNGATGKVVAINLPTIAVLDPSNTEKVIVIAPDTAIRRIHSTASSTDLRIGDAITAIGSPDAQGRILATFIRIMPMSTSSAAVSQQLQQR